MIDAVRVDIGFLIHEGFYHGPENGFTQEQWQQFHEPLYQPQVQRYGDYLLSSELELSLTELARYYHDVLRLMAHYGKVIGQESPYFWMRPLIFAPGEFAITFPWYDTWSDAAPMLAALTGRGDRLLFDDLEQGWEFQAFADEDRLFLSEGDFDSGKEHVAFATDRSKLACQVPALRERVARVLRELSSALGRDCWSPR